jgi:prepilin-type N-terminal cleavage/methylation domain-containing protein
VKNLRNTNKKTDSVGKQGGFTLIELLVVIAIIGLLASVVLLALNSARAKSRDAKRLADMRQLASALELYFNDSITGYPVDGGVVPTGLTPTHIGQLPTAPSPADGNCGTLGTNAYTYDAATISGSQPFYTYTFCLGADTGGYSSGTRTLTPRGIQ